MGDIAPVCLTQLRNPPAFGNLTKSLQSKDVLGCAHKTSPGRGVRPEEWDLIFPAVFEDG